MKNNVLTAIIATVAIASASVATANTTYIDLSGPLDIGTNPGQWRVDRYATDSFQASDGILTVGISENQGGGQRGNLFGTHYATQGYRIEIEPAFKLSVDIYIDEAWGNSPIQTGLWGVGRTSDGSTADYPIISYMANNESAVDGAGFYDWNTVTGEWSKTASVVSGKWYNLSMSFEGNNYLYEISDGGEVIGSALVERKGSEHIGDAILNTKNFFGIDDAATNYSVQYRNLGYSPVPEPSTYAAIFALGVAGYAIVRRRRQSLKA